MDLLSSVLRVLESAYGVRESHGQLATYSNEAAAYANGSGTPVDLVTNTIDARAITRLVGIAFGEFARRAYLKDIPDARFAVDTQTLAGLLRVTPSAVRTLESWEHHVLSGYGFDVGVMRPYAGVPMAPARMGVEISIMGPSALQIGIRTSAAGGRLIVLGLGNLVGKATLYEVRRAVEARDIDGTSVYAPSSPDVMADNIIYQNRRGVPMVVSPGEAFNFDGGTLLTEAAGFTTVVIVEMDIYRGETGYAEGCVLKCVTPTESLVCALSPFGYPDLNTLVDDENFAALFRRRLRPVENKAYGVMKAGNAFTVEPMINAGSFNDVTWPDKWTAVTADGERSAQFEHTFLVTDAGCEVLTQRSSGQPWFQDQLECCR